MEELIVGNISDTQCRAWTRRLGWQRKWLYPNPHSVWPMPKNMVPSPPSFSEIRWPARSPLSVPQKKIVYGWKFTMALGLKKKRNLSLAEFSNSSKAPINHLLGCHHDYCSETWWCRVKAGKMVSNRKYHDKEKENFFEWLMLHVATNVECEKLLSLHHPFDMQINEAMNNAVSRRCPKNKVFAGSGGLQYRVASVAGQHSHTRSNTIHKEFIRVMWYADASTVRILLETKRKATKWVCKTAQIGPIKCR